MKLGLDGTWHHACEPGGLPDYSGVIPGLLRKSVCKLDGFSLVDTSVRRW